MNCDDCDKKAVEYDCTADGANVDEEKLLCHTCAKAFVGHHAFNCCLIEVYKHQGELVFMFDTRLKEKKGD